MPETVDFHVVPSIFNGEIAQLSTDRFQYRGGIHLQSRFRKFGSYSGLDVSPDLSSLTAVGWGSWLSGSLKYDDAGSLAGFSLNMVRPLLDEKGTEIILTNDYDAEALFVANGSLYVGFEENNRVWRYSSISAAAEPIPVPSSILRDTPAWGGFSSITGTQDGQLLALTEGGQDLDGNTKGWLWNGGTNDPGAQIWLRTSPGWLPVDLTLLPDGDLLLVEVHLGESDRYDNSRFSRISRDDVAAGNIMQAEPIALLAPPNFEGRIEGIHAARGTNDETLVYMISDTSYNWPTQIFLFELSQLSQ